MAKQRNRPARKSRRESAVLGDDAADFLPPHELTPVPGFHAYARQWSVAPGQTLDICVSSDAPARGPDPEAGPGVRVAIMRHHHHTSVAELMEELGEFKATPQPIHRGSYIHIEKPVQPTGAFTVEAWFRQLAESPSAGLMSQAGFSFFLEGTIPCFTIRTDNGEVTVRGKPLGLKQWHHATGVYDETTLALIVDGVPIAQSPCRGPLHREDHPLRFGALGTRQQQATQFFTGDIWAPSIYRRAMTLQEIAGRYATRTNRPGKGCIGHWAFDALHGKPFRDTTASKRHGRGVNFPIRMIPGPRRIDDSDWATYDPLGDPDFGFAVRCMADAVIDCRWPVTARWTVPSDLTCGQYVARVTCANDASETSGGVRDVHFIVRPTDAHFAALRRTAHRHRQPRLLCISTTSTRCAYNFQPFANLALDYGAYQVHPTYPVLGQMLGWRRPATGEPWETTTVNFELPFFAWLQRMNIAHDVVSEWDLEADPRILDGYTVAAWAGHSEYWTVAYYEMLQRFHRRGGHLLAMSGNTAFWRVTCDLANAVMEVRKHDRRVLPGVTCDPMINAAHHHQFDHQPGGYLHAAGWPQASLGLGQSNGFTIPPLNGPRAGYEILDPNHDLFHSPHRIGTDFPFAPQAAGYETDLSLRSALEQFGEPQLPHYPARDGSPMPSLAKAKRLATRVLARARIPASGVLDYDVNYFPGAMWAEMMWTPAPGIRRNTSRNTNGHVFASGSVLSSEILLTDENFSNFLLNVLHRMGID